MLTDVLAASASAALTLPETEKTFAMLPCYVVLDLETTGGNAVHDRITEVAAVRIENGTVVERWSTLVNPHTHIPPFIQSLTGITDAMVANAPDFAEVAPRLMALLDGAVFVAHNVRFDHGFVLNEMTRLNLPFRVKTLCTVRLSRRLYPQHKGHGLDALMKRHGLHTQARHRAMGDVDMVLAWLNVANAELGSEMLAREAQELLQGSASVPPQLETPLEDIPDTPGVYLMYGEGSAVLYIGKSVHMRSRVKSHFQASGKVAREMRILQEVRRIEWQSTAGELGALLLESRLVKELQPIHNRLLRRERQLFSWLLAEDPWARPLIQLTTMQDTPPAQWDRLFGVFRSRKQALDLLRETAKAGGLCPQALGLESGKGTCFSHQIGHCKGLCAGKDNPALHRLRLHMALESHRIKTWPYPGLLAIREHDEESGRTDIHVFDQWCHVATVHDEAELEETRTTRTVLAFDVDTYRLLLRRSTVKGAMVQDKFVMEAVPV